MLHQGNKEVKKSKPSYFYAILSITLVLFLFGLMLVLIINTRKVSTYLKENLAITFVLNEGADEAALQTFQQQIAEKSYVKSSEYISKENAAEEFKTEYGEDFTELLGGENPLFSSINIFLTEDYANTDSLKKIEAQWSGHAMVEEVYYQRNLMASINDNVERLGMVLLGLSGLFFFVALILIDNTIKLAMFSNRFLIKSMQLVGAERKFITRPFLNQSLFNGILSGVLASILLAGILYLTNANFSYLKVMEDARTYGVLCLIIVALGAILSYVSTYQAVLKYLKTRLDDLY